MVTKADVLDTEKKLQEQLRKLRAAKKGLPTDGSVVETQADLARHYKVERSTIHGWIQKGMPGEPGRYVIADIDVWRSAQFDDDAILSSNADSPWLEECRRWTAQQKRIIVEKMLGSLVEADVMRDCWTQVAARLSRLVDRLARLYGADAEMLASDAVDDCERILSGVFATIKEQRSGLEINGNGNHSELATVEHSDSTDRSTGKPRARRVEKPKKKAKKDNRRVDRKRTDPSERAV